MREYDVILKVLAHIWVSRGFVFSGCCSPYIINLNFLLLANELFFALWCVYYFNCKSTEPTSYDSVNWVDFKIILLQAYHPVCMSFTQFLFYKQCANFYVRDVDYVVFLQQVGPEVFHRLVNYI